MSSKDLQIMIVAGEASGDLHAAKLVHELRVAANERVRFFGAAGPLMREAGVEAVLQSDDLAIVGVLEIATALPLFLRAFKSLKKAARERKPDVAVLVDFPDFNLKLAKALKKQGTRVVYYISPQLWAWRSYRVRAIKKYVDLMITILPFEKDWYETMGVTNVEYVGSPLAKEVHATRAKRQFCSDHKIDDSKPLVALLPGSRHKEIVRILPVMLESAAKMAVQIADVQFVMPLASERALPDVQRILRQVENESGIPKDLFIVTGETFDALKSSDVAAVTSGTATLETAIIGTPMAIVYRSSSLNYGLLRPLISVEHFGLVNLIAGERVAKELIQRDFTAETLSQELIRLLEPKVNIEMREKLEQTIEKLGKGGASKRAATAIMKMIGQPD